MLPVPPLSTKGWKKISDSNLTHRILIPMAFLSHSSFIRGVQPLSREQSPSPMNEPLRRAIVTSCVSPPDFFRRQLVSTVTAYIGNHTRHLLSVLNVEE